MMEFSINLIMGDRSGDGHDKHETVTIRSNLSKDEINQAYELGADKIGVDLCKDVADEYEDNSLSKENLQKFIDAGLDWEPLEDEESTSICTDEFLRLYLFAVAIGNPHFQYDIVKNQYIYIGGYGLFY